VCEPVHCTPGTAQRFMLIAKHPVLGNPAHVPHLPPSLMTLYELRLEPKRASVIGVTAPAR
jgi:hypothetical protein